MYLLQSANCQFISFAYLEKGPLGGQLDSLHQVYFLQSLDKVVRARLSHMCQISYHNTKPSRWKCRILFQWDMFPIIFVIDN